MKSLNLKIASTTRLGSMCGSSSTMSGAGPPETGRVLEVGQQHLEEVLEVHQVAGQYNLRSTRLQSTQSTRFNRSIGST